MGYKFDMIVIYVNMIMQMECQADCQVHSFVVFESYSFYNFLIKSKEHVYMFFFLTQEMMHASSLITNITAPCLLLQLFHTSSGKSGSIGKGAGFCGFVVCSLPICISLPCSGVL